MPIHEEGASSSPNPPPSQRSELELARRDERNVPFFTLPPGMRGSKRGLRAGAIGVLLANGAAADPLYAALLLAMLFAALYFAEK